MLNLTSQYFSTVYFPKDKCELHSLTLNMSEETDFNEIQQWFITAGTEPSGLQNGHMRQFKIDVNVYIGIFIMFSVITNMYNKKTKGPTLMEFFTATVKPKKFFFLTTREVWCVHHGWHGTHRYDIQATQAATCSPVCGKVVHHALSAVPWFACWICIHLFLKTP